MGYACPVCGRPQADGEHLANHLAFTAMLHGDDHEAWLDEHVPDWSNRAPDALASDVVERAEETDHEADSAEPVDGHDHVRRGPPGRPPEELDAETRRIVEEAREMTRRKLGDEERGEE